MPTPDRPPARIETCFEELLGRKATEAERARLYRLRDVLGLRDNDALWCVVMALEHYDSFFRAYPAQLAQVLERSLQKARSAAVERQPRELHRARPGELADACTTNARSSTGPQLAVHQFTTALAAVVAFGALCVHAGYELAGTGRPFWVAAWANASGAPRALLGLLSLPAGWMVFALLVPLALRGANLGWRMATDPCAVGHERGLGWCLIAFCLLSLVACTWVLSRIA